MDINKHVKMIVELNDFLNNADSVELHFKSQELFNEASELAELGNLDFIGVVHSLGNLVENFNGDVDAVRRYCHMLILISYNLESAKVYRKDDIND